MYKTVKSGHKTMSWNEANRRKNQDIYNLQVVRNEFLVISKWTGCLYMVMEDMVVVERELFKLCDIVTVNSTCSAVNLFSKSSHCLDYDLSTAIYIFYLFLHDVNEDEKPVPFERGAQLPGGQVNAEEMMLYDVYK